ESPEVAIGILLVAILLEGFSFRTAVVESGRVKGEMGWWTFIRRSKQPELPVVLLEDLGALIGLVLALAALTTAHVTGDAVWDGYGTLGIGILLVVIAAILAVEMKGLLIGESASEQDQQRIAAAIEIEPSVTRLLHMRTEHIGPDELLVGAKIELVRGLSVDEVTEVVNRVESSVRRAVPTARIMYLEPDVFRTSTPAGEEPRAAVPPPPPPPTPPSPRTEAPAGAATPSATPAAVATEGDTAVAEDGTAGVAAGGGPADRGATGEPDEG
ncbi:MAG TPA: cation transporter dimerization domain-containing protein, partial [Acidimicrobiales bacterium]